MRLSFTKGAVDIVLAMLAKQKATEKVSIRVNENGLYCRAARADGEVHVAQVKCHLVQESEEHEHGTPILGIGAEAKFLAAGFRMLLNPGCTLEIKPAGDAGTMMLLFQSGGGEIRVMTGEDLWMPLSHEWGEGCVLDERINPSALAAMGSSVGAVDKNVIGIRGTRVYAWIIAGSTPGGGVLYDNGMDLPLQGAIGMTASMAGYLSSLRRVGTTKLYTSDATVKVGEKLRPQALLIEAESEHGRLSVVGSCIDVMPDAPLDKLASFPELWAGTFDKEELKTNLDLVTEFLPVDDKGHRIDGSSCEFQFQESGLSVQTKSAAGGGTLFTGCVNAEGDDCVGSFSLVEVLRMVQMADTDGVRVSIVSNPATGTKGIVVRDTEGFMAAALAERRKA